MSLAVVRQLMLMIPMKSIIVFWETYFIHMANVI